MGACTFKTYGFGNTIGRAYDMARENAIEEYGHQDGYNGTISTTHGFRDVTNDYKKSKKDLQQFVNDSYDKLSKRDCCAICIEEPKVNKNKIKTQVDNIVTPGTKKWVLKYVVRKKYSEIIIGSYATKTQAVKVAREYTERTKESTEVSMEKILEKGSNLVAKVSYKKSTEERDGKWIFFGWAAE